METKKSFTLIFLLLVLSISIAIAAITIKTSTDTDSFSIDEDTATAFFNISVNNTYDGFESNITSVNITLPASFTFVVDTNGSNATESLFANASNVLSWTNGTDFYIINGTEQLNFWFNATASLPGTYSIMINVTNITGSYATNISVEVNDTTVPIATLGTNPANALITPSRTVIFDFKCNDTYAANDMVLWGNWSGSWIANTTNNSYNDNEYANVSLDLVADGIFKWAVYCNDTAGNGDWSENRTFTTTADPTASLGNPVDYYNSSNASIVFDIKCADGHNVEDIVLWGNWSGSWTANNTNTSAINDTFSNITVINVNTTDGIYKWAAFCNDTDENSDWSANRTLIIDRTAPTASASCDASTVYVGDPITCTCIGGDATSGVASSSANTTTNPATAGSHTYTCAVTDFAGNDATNSTASYTARGSSGRSSSTDTTTWSATFAVTDTQLANSVDKQLSVKQRVKVSVNSENHYIGVTALSATTATISVTSTPQTATLSIGEEKKFDVAGDSNYDLKVTLNSISSRKADITIQSINEPIPTTTTPATDDTAADDDDEEDTTIIGEASKIVDKTIDNIISNKTMWIIGIIVVIILIVLIASAKGKKKK